MTELLSGAREYIKGTELPDVFIIKRPRFEDERGSFGETLRRNELEAILGRSFVIEQQNHSESYRNVLRGIHIAPWDKCVYVTRGTVQQVVVDLREDSPAFGKYVSLVIGDKNKVKVFVPAGCGNAFLVLSGVADYIYDTNGYWSAGSEKDVAWNDQDLAIPWQTRFPDLSPRDIKASNLKQVFPHKFILEDQGAVA